MATPELTNKDSSAIDRYKTLPNNLEAEQALLGSALLSKEAANRPVSYTHLTLPTKA